jgi:hypothetical protein
MLPADHKHWQIVEEHQFLDELMLTRRDPVRADEFVDGVKRVLCRNPQAGTQIGERIWLIPMAVWTHSIYYTFDDDSVYLHSIKAVETPNTTKKK